MPVESRLTASRKRLLSHPSLETAPDSILPSNQTFEPRLLVRILSQLDERDKYTYHGLNPIALADRDALAKISCAASLSDERWTRTISKGCASPSAINKSALKAIAQHPLKTPCFLPGTKLVDDAMSLALETNKAFEATRQKLRDAIRRTELAEAERKRRSAFPKEWANLAPPNGNTTGESGQQRQGADNPMSAKGLDEASGDVGSTKRISTRSSTVEKDTKCCFCPDDSFGQLPNGDESELLGPFVNSRGRATLYVHFDCACWAPQVFADPKTSQFRGVYDEYRRGRQLRCSGCRGKGATVGCYIEKCKRVFHFRCLDDAGAKKVTQFFAAFCKQHAHLAEKDTYKLMMRAHTIADVATARRESTDGLDAPHSKYTKLRRRDTEIIFSRSAGICSHNGVYEHRKTLFSSARRAVMSNNEQLRVDDRVRLVRHSAIAVASGYLALLASGRTQDDADDDVTATEARAAIASRHSTPLFLLRNLEGAPNWTPDEIVVSKSARRRSVHFNQRMKKYANRMLPGVEQMNESNDETSKRTSTGKRTSPDNDKELPRTRSGQTKARRLNEGGSSKTSRESAPLPTLKNHRLSGTKFLKATGPVQSENEDDVSDAAAQSPPPSPKKKKSGWDVFLAEQLPRERAVRPEDDMDVAMSNMARMWSLLSTGERTGYENRAIAATITSPKPAANKSVTPVVLPSDAPRRLRPENRAAGLFSLKPPAPASEVETVTSKRSREPIGSKSKLLTESMRNRGSVAMPPSKRRTWRTVREEPDQPANPNWDDMFPIDLTSAQPSAVDGGSTTTNGGSVAPPPPRK